MKSSGNLRVLICAAGGARRGYEHLMGALAFARKLGVRPLIAVRGSEQARLVALGFGGVVVAAGATAAIRALRPDVVVIGDPSARLAQKQIEAARLAGALVVTIGSHPDAPARITDGFISLSEGRATSLQALALRVTNGQVSTALSQGN